MKISRRDIRKLISAVLNEAKLLEDEEEFEPYIPAKPFADEPVDPEPTKYGVRKPKDILEGAFHAYFLKKVEDFSNPQKYGSVESIQLDPDWGFRGNPKADERILNNKHYHGFHGPIDQREYRSVESNYPDQEDPIEHVLFYLSESVIQEISDPEGKSTSKLPPMTFLNTAMFDISVQERSVIKSLEAEGLKIGLFRLGKESEKSETIAVAIYDVNLIKK